MEKERKGGGQEEEGRHRLEPAGVVVAVGHQVDGGEARPLLGAAGQAAPWRIQYL